MVRRVRWSRRFLTTLDTTVGTPDIFSANSINVPSSLRPSTATRRHNVSTKKKRSSLQRNLPLTNSISNCLPYKRCCSLHTNIPTIKRITIQSKLSSQQIPSISPVDPNPHQWVTSLPWASFFPLDLDRNRILTRRHIHQQLILTS